MKRNVYITTAIIFFNLYCLSAQNIAVEYLVKENKNNSLTSTEYKCVLVIKGSESIYFNPKADASQFRHNANATEIETSNRTLVKFDDNTYGEIKNELVYKNYKIDSLIFNESMVNKKVVVAEAIDLFKWTVIPGSDSVILGYKCHLATSTFRGRKYEAYFSSTLNAFGGPWKFDGLPGLVLAARSIDNYFVLTPMKITLNDRSFSVYNPYKSSKEIMSWGDFVTQFEKKLQQILKLMKSKSEPGEQGTIKITDRIEDLGIKELSFN